MPLNDDETAAIDIIARYHEKWDELAVQLELFRDTMGVERKEEAEQLGLNTKEKAFYNVLEENINRDLTEEQQQEFVEVARQLVVLVSDRTAIINFFQKQDEVNDLRKEIKRILIDTNFDDDSSLRKKIIDETMNLAKVHFSD